ncbi:MAG: hypothetical protein JWQ40_4909 [Segetibacter sp.]|nr:hypothetical protein [Segetibacter sp.]
MLLLSPPLNLPLFSTRDCSESGNGWCCFTTNNKSLHFFIALNKQGLLILHFIRSIIIEEIYMKGSNCKRLYFMLLPFITVFLMSFEANGIKTGTPDTFCISSSSHVSSVFSFPTEIETAFRELKNNTDIETDVSDVKKRQVKYKKKFKRSPQVSTGIRPPAKDLESADFDSSSKTPYSKPHFLSHLHHFLFRLTPF